AGDLARHRRRAGRPRRTVIFLSRGARSGHLIQSANPILEETRMTVSARTLKWLLLTGIASLCVARSAAAAPNPTTCANDIDCVETPQCGGDVCDYTVQPPVGKPADSL